MHSKSDNIEINESNETNEINEKLFDSLLQKQQEGLEESMKGSEFVLLNVDLLNYKCLKISVNRVGLDIDSPKCLRNKKNNSKF